MPFVKKSSSAALWDFAMRGARATGKKLSREERKKYFRAFFLRHPADQTTHSIMDQIIHLQLTRPEFLGKKVLDLGTNNRDLSNALEAAGAKKCISLTLGNKLRGKKKSVRGAAQELPFKDNSFDTIISHCGGLYYSVGSGFFESFYWALRALKPGGRIIVFPRPEPTQLAVLERCGFKIDRQFAPRIRAPDKEKTLQALLSCQVEKGATLSEVLDEKATVFTELVKND